MALRLHVLVALLLACACEPTSRVELGKAQYDEYCSSCHPIEAGGGLAGGEEAVGPDLTRLRERYGSPLSRDELAAFIDGRRAVEAHGPREMPVWGARLYEDYPQTPGTEVVRVSTIDILIDYLEAVQRE